MTQMRKGDRVEVFVRDIAIRGDTTSPHWKEAVFEGFTHAAFARVKMTNRKFRAFACEDVRSTDPQSADRRSP
jgi:hypothetical protein